MFEKDDVIFIPKGLEFSYNPPTWYLAVNGKDETLDIERDALYNLENVEELKTDSITVEHKIATLKHMGSCKRLKVPYDFLSNFFIHY